MTTVNDVLNFIESIAPPYMKEEWDKVGLLCGDTAQPVSKILVALDPFEYVCDEAIRIGADLVVTHHPLIFHPMTAITTATSIGRSIIKLSRAGISAINAHTNYDCAPGGINDILANVLELQGVSVVSPKGQDLEGRDYGLLRTGTFEASLPDFLEHIKQKLGTPVVRYVKGGDKVCRVAVGGGSCGGALMEAYTAGCDTFVTADIKYNQFWDAKELGMNLIDAGHFYTENPACHVLADRLQAAFPGVAVEFFKNHRDCMEFA